MTYLFDPEVLAEVVRMHVGMEIEQQFAGVAQTLVSIYGDHVSPGQRWTWSNAGGIMCAMSPLHVSTREYLLFCGTAVGSEGHSGRHRADMYELVMAGELWTYEAGSFERHVHRPGDLVALRRGSANGSKLRPGLWMLEYARGNIASLFPFAFTDTLFSTLDFRDLGRQVAISTKLMLKEMVVRFREQRLGQPFIPNLSVLRAKERSAKRPPKRNKGRTLAN
ncbi:MAG TPA: ERG2 family protein [Polyangiaceae bacterium]|nr:ERG2 family protein [Polyangiaceae bacterium]